MHVVTRCVLISLTVLGILGCGRSASRSGTGTATATGTPASPGAPSPGQATEAHRPAEPPGEFRFVAEGQPSITLRLSESPGGGVTGTLSEGGQSMPLVARRVGAGFKGTVGRAGDAMPFTATEHGDRVVLDIGDPDEAQRLIFRRASEGDDRAARAPDSGQRNVVINEHRLSDEELARAEQTYRIRIPDADYWYDRVLGAWGAKGHPTMGFIAPGLELGGPLRADASGGGTSVFVNGRELPPSDLMALQQITGPVPPGRYFITPQGLAGYEGGPAQWDLAALAARSGGGGSNTWQSRLTGASGFSDGHTGAVFLPNGGIVSTGD